MQFNKVEICGVNTSKLKVLSEAEKMSLLKKCHEGDTRAREDLVNGNLRLVLSVIQRFTQRFSALRTGEKIWMTCFRWDVLDSLRPSIILTLV